MKKIFLTSIIAAGLVSSAIASPNGDLILGFRDTNVPATNLQFDLGAASLFQTGGTYALGGAIDTGINAGTLLSSTYGSGFMTDAGLLWGAIGTNGNTTSTRDLWVTAGGTAATGVATSTAWNVRSATSQSSQASAFISVGGTTTAAIGSGTVVGSATANSWSNKETGGPNAFGAFPILAFEASTGGGFADLYEMNPQASGPGVGNPGVFLGTFSIGGNGDVFFTTLAAIPEPSTYAAILGVATLGFAAIRRRKQAQLAV